MNLNFSLLTKPARLHTWIRNNINNTPGVFNLCINSICGMLLHSTPSFLKFASVHWYFVDLLLERSGIKIHRFHLDLLN